MHERISREEWELFFSNHNNNNNDKVHCDEEFLSVLGKIARGEKMSNRDGQKQRGETSAGLGVGAQVRGITGEKVPLLIAALELWPALWNTKGRSDTLHCLGLVNICPALLECPAFSLGSPTNPCRLRPPAPLAALVSLSGGSAHLQ